MSLPFRSRMSCGVQHRPERVAKILHDAMAEGRLTVSELEERLDKVYAAKTFGELEPLLRDLPVQAAGRRRSTRADDAQQPDRRPGHLRGRGRGDVRHGAQGPVDRPATFTRSP